VEIYDTTNASMFHQITKASLATVTLYEILHTLEWFFFIFIIRSFSLVSSKVVWHCVNVRIAKVLYNSYTIVK